MNSPLYRTFDKIADHIERLYAHTASLQDARGEQARKIAALEKKVLHLEKLLHTLTDHYEK